MLLALLLAFAHSVSSGCQIQEMIIISCWHFWPQLHQKHFSPVFLSFLLKSALPAYLKIIKGGCFAHFHTYYMHCVWKRLLILSLHAFKSSRVCMCLHREQETTIITSSCISFDSRPSEAHMIKFLMWTHWVQICMWSLVSVSVCMCVCV